MDLDVGQKRTFSFSENPFEIKEIIDQPQGITLTWTWGSSICPHCKKKIENITHHSFYRIEILVQLEKNGTEKEKTTKEDIVVLGHAHDGRLMQFPLDKFNEVLRMSKDFKSFIEGE